MYTLNLFEYGWGDKLWALTEKEDYATIILQADLGTETDTNPLNIKSESWQRLTEQGMTNVEFKIDVIETDCFINPGSNMITMMNSLAVDAAGTTTTATTKQTSITSMTTNITTITTSTTTSFTTTTTTTTSTTSTSVTTTATSTTTNETFTTKTTTSTKITTSTTTTTTTTTTTIITTVTTTESIAMTKTTTTNTTEYTLISKTSVPLLTARTGDIATAKSNDDMMPPCQIIPKNTFHNGAQECKNLGLRFPTPVDIDQIGIKNAKFWIGARNVNGKWKDEFNRSIDPIDKTSSKSIWNIFGIPYDFCLYFEADKIQRLSCHQTKPVVCCRDRFFKPFPPVNLQITTLTTSSTQAVPSTTKTTSTTSTLITVTTVEAVEMFEQVAEKQNAVFSLSCFEPSWLVFDDKTLIKLKVLDRTKCLGICQRIDHCLAFSAQENFCLFKMSLSIENLQSVTAMLSAFLG